MTGDGHFRRMEDIIDDVTAIAIDHNSGNVAAAARYLGVTRGTVYRRMKNRAESQSGPH